MNGILAPSRANCGRPQPAGAGRFNVERSMIEFLAPAKGYVEWKCVRKGKEALAREIQASGAFSELVALLPAAYEPPVVATAETEEAAA